MTEEPESLETFSSLGLETAKLRTEHYEFISVGTSHEALAECLFPVIIGNAFEFVVDWAAASI